MEENNTHWIDLNNNKWLKSVYTKEQAERYSNSLSNCSDCSNCSNCSDCSDCRYCSNCSDCRYCRNCSDCRYCSDCSDCSDCSNCSNCKYCSNCSDFNRNPNRYTGNPIGSRRSQTTTYWLLGNIQVVCGCFRGNLSAFKEAVASKHKGNQHEQEYLQYIKIVETIMSMEV